MRKSKISYWLGWLVFSIGYLVLSQWLASRGFYTLESFFVDYRADILVRFPEGFLRTFYFTSPAVFFLSSVPFNFISSNPGSFFLNALLIGGLTNHLFFKSWKGKYPSKFFFLYILFSPVILFAGTSGTSLAVYLVLYYLLFYVTFKYTESHSVFHLTLMSLTMGLFVLMDMEYMKLILLLVPVLFFVSFFKAKGIRGNFYTRASVIFSNNSQRRKFFTGFFSSVLIVAFIPLMSYLIFLMINKVFSGSYFFFERSTGDSWNSYSVLFPLISINEDLWPNLAQINSRFLGLILLLSVTAIYQILDSKNQAAKSFILILVILFAISEAADNKMLYLDLNNLSLITASAIAAFFYSQNGLKSRSLTLKVLTLALPVLAVLLEFGYFENSIVQQERHFAASIFDPKEDPNLKSIEKASLALQNQNSAHILADDAIFYPELSTLDKSFTWEGHFSPYYMHALQQPEAYADLILVTKKEHPLHLNDIVATSLKRLDSLKIELPKKVIYEDEYRQVIQLIK